MKLLTEAFADHLPPRSVEKLSYEAIVKQSKIMECYISISSVRKGSKLYLESPACFPPFSVSWSFPGKIKLLFQGDQGWACFWKVTKEIKFQSHKAMGHITFLIWENWLFKISRFFQSIFKFTEKLIWKYWEYHPYLHTQNFPFSLHFVSVWYVCDN